MNYNNGLANWEGKESPLIALFEGICKNINEKCFPFKSVYKDFKVRGV